MINTSIVTSSLLAIVERNRNAQRCLDSANLAWDTGRTERGDSMARFSDLWSDMAVKRADIIAKEMGFDSPHVGVEHLTIDGDDFVTVEYVPLSDLR